MVIVIPNGNASATSAPDEIPLALRMQQNSGAMGSPGAMTDDKISESLVKDLVPFIESTS